MCAFFMNISAQKLYIWKPSMEDIAQRGYLSLSDTIDIVLYDGRAVPKESKVECSSEELMNEIVNNLKTAYAGATCIVYPPSSYHKKPLSNHITIKIGISAYQAGFGDDVEVGVGREAIGVLFGSIPKTRWNALTAMNVIIYDKRNGREVKQTKTIQHGLSKHNTWGYKTSRGALHETYVHTMIELFLLIDNSLMEE